MKVIVGLGNPGEKYEKTRHNLGFMVADQLLEKLERVEKTFWDDDKKLKADTKQITFKNSPSGAEPLRGGASILLVKPKTFMNNSGESVLRVLNYYKVTPENIIVVQDDLDLPFGKIRVRFGGAAGGHHGVESIIEHLKTDKFLRVRLGIGHPRDHDDHHAKSRNYQNVDDYVLGDISSDERGKTKTMIKETIKTVELILEHGIDVYMAKYNK